MILKTLKYRIKDASTKKHLMRQAASVNYVWNYCNEWAVKRFGYNGCFLSGYDLQKLTSGCSKELGILAQTAQSVCEQYAIKRRQFKKIKLKWRSAKRSLGWIPFKQGAIILLEAGKFKFNGKVYRYWDSRPILSKIRCGSFTQDAKGRWYVNFIVEDIAENIDRLSSSVGLDLGLKTTATYSDGSKFDGVMPFRKYEQELASAQRARKKKRVVSIHAKIANCRKDSIHKETTKIADTHERIFVGNVSSTKLIKTKLAKSVLDAGWGLYRTLLEYKVKRLGGVMVIVNERYSTVTCSQCLNRTFAGGLSSLGVREWTCSNCGSQHDRDINAAKNILRVGLHTLKEEFPDNYLEMRPINQLDNQNS
jgi:putative transposase